LRFRGRAADARASTFWESARAALPRESAAGFVVQSLECPPTLHQKLFDDGSERKRREKRERADDQHRSYEQAHEQRAMRGKCPSGRWRFSFRRETSGR